MAGQNDDAYASDSTIAVVTGVGVAAPNGLGTDAYWAATLEGRSGIAPLTEYDASNYPTALAGLIKDFRPSAHISDRLLPQTDRVSRLALAAADWALADAGVSPGELPEYGAGVVTSNATGGFEFTHREFRKLWSQGPEHVSVYESFAWFYAVNTGQISIRHGLRGPSGVVVSEQAGGLDATGHARRLVRKGTNFVLTGGMDSALDPWGLVSHHSGGRLSREPDPLRAFLPFDLHATGYLPGEGGAILVLEDARHARDRGVRQVYGQVAGYSATFDPVQTPGHPTGIGRAAAAAIADAGLTPDDIDVVLADAAGVPEDDRIEAEAINAIFGPYGVPVTAPKTLVGRLCAGGSALDLVTALLCIRDGVIPPTANVDAPVPRDRLDLVRGEPRPAAVRAALVLARGRGGFNAAIVVISPPKPGGTDLSPGPVHTQYNNQRSGVPR